MEYPPRKGGHSLQDLSNGYRFMKICVIGAGAIGGLLAAKLAHSGEDVSVIARRVHLASIVDNGLVLLEEGQRIVARVAASDRIADVLMEIPKGATGKLQLIGLAQKLGPG